MKTWLVTGGCGFVGSNLADSLLKEGNSVVVFDNFSRIGSRENLDWLRREHGKDFRVIEGDTRSSDTVLQAVSDSKPDFVAHLAGQVAATTSIENPRLDFEVNALGALNVLEAVRARRSEAVVMFSSTNKVYGSLDYLAYEENETRYRAPGYEEGFDESLPLDGSTPYGCSKLAADSYFRDYFRIFGIRTIVFRHSSMYGGRQFSTFDQGWVGWFCLKALEMKRRPCEPISIAGTGKQVRDLLYSSDLISCYFKGAAAADRAAGHVFNIGGGMANSLSLRELFLELGRLTSQDIHFRCEPWRPADQKVFVASTEKASRLLDWSPRIGYEVGLRRMLEWSATMLDISGGGC